MADTTRIPVGGRGLTREEVQAVLGTDLQIDSSTGSSGSVDMDPGTASLVVGLATAVPQLIAVVAAAWGKWRKSDSDPATASATVVVETAADEIVIRVGEDGVLMNEDAEPLDERSLPESPRQILRIHLR